MAFVEKLPNSSVLLCQGGGKSGSNREFPFSDIQQFQVLRFKSAKNVKFKKCYGHLE